MGEKCLVDPTRECAGLEKAKEVEKELEEFKRLNSETHKEMFGRIGALERFEGIQTERYDNIIEKLNALSMKHDSLNKKLETLESKPGKRWDSMVEKAIWAVIAAVITFLLARLGLPA